MAPEYQKQRGRCPLFRFRYVRLFAQVARMYGLCSQNVCPFKYIMWGNIIQEREQQHGLRHNSDGSRFLLYIWHTPSMLHFGDWVAPDVPKMSQWQGRSKWTATASLYNTSRLTGMVADILGEKEDAEYFRKLSEKVSDAYVSVFTDGKGKMKEEFQTAYVLPLWLHMLPENV